MEKYLKPRQHYIDLYDRHTVDHCRRAERICEKPSRVPIDENEVSKEQTAQIEAGVKKLYLYFKAGERYINKSETIRKWMDVDQKKDDFYESAEAPADIRCLTCRNRMKPTSKHLHYESEKEDRVWFMYECPNKCLPHRIFFSDGEEWRIKPHLCLKCNSSTESASDYTGQKLITTYTCTNCGYIETEEFEWAHRDSKEDDVDPDFAKDRDRFCLTDEEGEKYRNEKYRLEQLAKLAEDWKEEEKRRADKLKENPQGFHLDGAGYTCAICRHGTPQGDNWYDEYGIKCLVCQKAIDEGEIPASLAKDHDSWYSKWELEDCFNVKGPALRNWIKKGIIKSRTLSHYGKGVWYELFMIDDNKDFLPPKDMVKSQSVTEKVKDGGTSYRSYPWYCFVNPVEHLKDYKIMDHLRVLTPDEVKIREEEKKKKNEEKEARRVARRERRLKGKKRG